MPQENMLARYKILHELGRGALGAVYAARDRETGAVVALKRFDPASLGKSDAKAAERLLKHARSTRALKHRNIVDIRDAADVGGTVYVAMELLEGESLRKILDEGPLPIGRAIHIAHDVASGLAHAHLEGVLHGSLKPSNVIVLRSGVAKITDFGIGQPAPASPEQARGEPVDHRCDIFALGALFYEMLTHRPPLAGSSPPPPSEVNPHVPRALDALVLGMLAPQPADRMAGVPILLQELQRLEEGLGLGSGAGAGTDEPTVPPPAPRPTPAAAPAPRPTPEANRFRERAPMQDEPRFADTPAGEERAHRPRITDREAFDYQKAMLMMEREARRERASSGSRSTMLATLALVLAVLGIGLTAFMYYSSDPGLRAIAQEALATAHFGETPRPAATTPEAEAPRPAVPTPVAETMREPAPPPVAPPPAAPRVVDERQPVRESLAASSAPDPMPPKPVAAEPSPLPKTETVVTRAPEQPAPVVATPGQKPRAMQPTAKLPQQQPGGMARLVLVVSPRGEIYIDGKHHGTTPPLTTLDLEPGMHRIEVLSGSRKPYLTYMTVQAGEVRRIQYDFDTSRAVYPPRSASWQSSERAAR